jgi:hypothetical protein
MKSSEMTLGRRVRISQTIDIYPLGIFSIGLTGTVTQVAVDPDGNTPSWYVRLDEYRPELEEWDNELEVWSEDSDSGIAVSLPSMFEVVSLDIDFAALAADARPINDDDWGSERQQDAERRFDEAFLAVMGGKLTDRHRVWCLKATTEERIDECMRLLYLNETGAIKR